MRVFTTGQIARLVRVAPRTVSKWFDSGRLQGYRIPGTADRRIPEASLAKFLAEHGMPTIAEYEAPMPLGSSEPAG
jgi:two-component system response regulator RpaA